MPAFLDRPALSAVQLSKLNRGLSFLRARNPFYRRKLEGLRLPLEDLHSLQSLPFTLKDEWISDQAANPPFGTNLSTHLSRYTRLHRTSGTTGGSLYWLDTDRTWRWFLRCWREVYRGAGVGKNDVVFAAFGFGPFLGFWGAFDAAETLGALAVSGGAQDSLARLNLLLETRATVLLATPTYALRLAHVARENGVDLKTSAIRATIHAGEPGANIPATRSRIEDAWGALAYDHAGMTEVGAWGFECRERSGLHLIETSFVGEVLAPGSDRPVARGQEGELVLTNLGRWDMPAVRYRTGDIVKVGLDPCACGRAETRFEGGVLGRADDMIHVRGVNVYPSAVENLIRDDPDIIEFRVEVTTEREMAEMRVLIEVATPARSDVTRSRLEESLRVHLGLRAAVDVVPSGALPRFELKSRRFVTR